MTSRVKMGLGFQTSFHEHYGCAIWRERRKDWIHEVRRKMKERFHWHYLMQLPWASWLLKEKWASFGERCPPVLMFFLVRKERDQALTYSVSLPAVTESLKRRVKSQHGSQKQTNKPTTHNKTETEKLPQKQQQQNPSNKQTNKFYYSNLALILVIPARIVFPISPLFFPP